MITEYVVCSNVQTTEPDTDNQIWSASIQLKMSPLRIIPRFSESPVLITTSAAALITVDPHPSIAKKQTALTSRSVVEGVPSESFYVLKATISASLIYIPKFIYFTTALPLANKVITSIAWAPRRSTKTRKWNKYVKMNTFNIANFELIDTIIAIFRLELDKNMLLHGQDNLECTDAERLKSSCTREVKHDAKYGDHKNELLGLLLELKDMWNDYLGRINTVKHLIKLTLPGGQPVHSAAYREGQGACKVDKDEIDKMLQTNIIETDQSKWPSAIAIDPKKKGSSTHLLWLSETKFRPRQGFISTSKDGRMYRHSWRGLSIVNIIGTFGILASWGRQRKSIWNSIHVVARNLQIRHYVSWTYNFPGTFQLVTDVIIATANDNSASSTLMTFLYSRNYCPNPSILYAKYYTNYHTLELLWNSKSTISSPIKSTNRGIQSALWSHKL